MEQTEETKVVNIMPLSVGKRILVFLADFFLNFILGFAIMNLITTPLAKAFTSFKDKNAEYSTNLNTRADILYENKILFKSGDVDDSEIVYNTSFTFRCYLSYFAFDEESPLGANYPQYGHKVENDTIKHYFIDIMDDSEKFITLFDRYNQTSQYFTRDGLTITIKEDIKEQIAPFFIKNGTVSSLATTYINNIETQVFTPLNCEVFESINKNDLKFEGKSYLKTQSSLRAFESYFNSMITYSAFTAVLISSFVLFFIVPICNKNRRTFAMMLMKIDRVNVKKLNLIKKFDCFTTFVYQFLMSFVIAFFVPIGPLTLAEIFNIPVLMIFAMFSLLLSLASMIFLFFNKYNQSMFDYFTRVVYLTSGDLDEIYRSKGYKI